MASSGVQDVEMRSPGGDSASSLRELALKSIKSRRKPHSESILPLRPPPAEATFQLDYGQEDDSPSHDDPYTITAPTAEPPASKSPDVAPPPQAVPAPPSLSISRPTPVPDNQAREEGEISDEEHIQAAPQPPKPPPPLPHPASTLQIPKDSRHSTPSAATQVPLEPPQPRPPLFERLSDHPFASGSQASRSEESSCMQTDPVPVLPASSYPLDTDHIRPGVALNQDQYDKAKDIVLDLLGWGVEPEYLVDCGVTREVVYYVFTELNLRLPQNLDTIGLVPFTPEDALELQKSVMMPPPPPPPPPPPARARHPPQPDSMNALVHTPSPPPPASPPSVSATVIESPRPVSTSDLHDMEQQRRQELMARKAAIASKKLKNVPPSVPGASSLSALVSSNSNPSDDMNMDSVEDFLKSIGSSSASTSNAATTTVDDMDVDEIPGLSGASSYKASTSASANPPSSTLTSPTESPLGLLSPDEPPPTSTESGSTMQSTGSSTSSQTDPEGPTPQRRVTRRPVASDFVDFDEGRPPSHNSRNGYRHVRRRPTGFASVISQPRCIIDVSDSEGEGDGDVVMTVGYISPVPTKPFIAHLDTNGWATPPVSTRTPTPSTATPTGTTTPAVLLEKENEIQRMREIIAQKERRLKEAKALEVKVKREETPVTLAAEDAAESPVTSWKGSSHSTPDSIGHITQQDGNSEQEAGRQGMNATPIAEFVAYDSVFNWYPLLVGRGTDGVRQKLDPGKRVCQYEVPGPGECRDEGCVDIHLRRLGE